MATKGHEMMSGEGCREGNKPAGNIGQQRRPIPLTDQSHDNAPMDSGRRTTNEHESRNSRRLVDKRAPSTSSSVRLSRHGSSTQSEVRRLCFCVDDVGLNPGVVEAVSVLVAMRRVHAISCMVGGQAWRQAAPVVRGFETVKVDVGLHIDLTERPITIRPFKSLRSLVANSYLHRLDLLSIRREICAQMDRFEQTVGRPPSFVDGHQHVHQLPGVSTELLHELTHRYPVAMPWLRSTRVARPSIPALSIRWREAFKPRVIAALGAAGLAFRARRLGLLQNNHLLGVYDFNGGSTRYRSLMEHWLSTASDADLLMCHPGLDRYPDDALAHSRRQEYEILKSVELGIWIDREGIELAPMSVILAAPQ